MKHPFYIRDNGNEPESKVVKLAPKLSWYTARLEYDDAGNANVVIRHKDNGVVLDFCLDNGDINEMKGVFDSGNR